MKKAIVTLSVILLTAMSAFADGGDQPIRYYAQKSTQGWFIDLAGTYSVFAANGSAYHNITTYYGGFNSTNPRHLFGLSGKVGRRIGPSSALRIGYDWHPSYNQTNYFNFKSLHADFMESPLDLFLGYNPERFYTMWVYAGVGLLAYDPFPVGKTHSGNYRYLIHWDSNLELGVHAGIMNNFRINNSLDFHVDFTGVMTKWAYDASAPTMYTPWHRAHFDFSGMVGIMWYLGGRSMEKVVFEKPAPVVIDCSAQDRRINELLEDLAKCQAKNNEVQPCDTVKVVVPGESISYPFSIFFNKGSYELRDSRDLQNLKEFAKVAKDNGYKIVLRGTADNATGSAAYNQTLTERRCEKIRSELVKLGVPASNITVDPAGGVREQSPAELDRRVFIHFTK